MSRQSELKSALLSGESLNLESGSYSAHDCASVLKIFLSNLPEPILQEKEYHVHCRIAGRLSPPSVIYEVFSFKQIIKLVYKVAYFLK